VLLKERIIVLKTFKHGDANLVIHGLNALGARMNFFARGAAKSRKRFGGGVLEPTHYLEVNYKAAKSQDDEPLHSLLEAQIVREFPKLRENFERLDTALYFVRLVHKVSQQGVIDSPDMFNLLGNALAAAETTVNTSLLRLQFEVKMLQAQGVLSPNPELNDWLTHPISQHGELIITPNLNHQIHEQIRNLIGVL
jgi:DNA repair protein RecO (recombination protein O)